MPVSLGVAVLKYRLYELDRIISRVVSYALITAVLVGFYTGLVLLTTHVLPFKSAVAVAACTLITAALFNPLRRGCSGQWTGGSTGRGTTPRPGGRVYRPDAADGGLRRRPRRPSRRGTRGVPAHPGVDVAR
jgi:hypothetical protein